jgi:hypothetical protein
MYFLRRLLAILRIASRSFRRLIVYLALRVPWLLRRAFCPLNHTSRTLHSTDHSQLGSRLLLPPSDICCHNTPITSTSSSKFSETRINFGQLLELNHPRFLGNSISRTQSPHPGTCKLRVLSHKSRTLLPPSCSQQEMPAHRFPRTRVWLRPANLPYRIK